jgi:hypothetical protein
MANSSTTNGGTVLTIPPNSNWFGSFSLSATLAVAIGSAASTAVPSITVSTAGGASMNNGDTVAAVALAVPAVNALGLLGSTATATADTGPLNIQTRANQLQLVLNYGAGVTAVGSAVGYFQ